MTVITCNNFRHDGRLYGQCLDLNYDTVYIKDDRTETVLTIDASGYTKDKSGEQIGKFTFQSRECDRNKPYSSRLSIWHFMNNQGEIIWSSNTNDCMTAECDFSKWYLQQEEQKCVAQS